MTGPGTRPVPRVSQPLPVRDPAALAAALKTLGLPGQRSKTAITRLRRDRERHRAGVTDLRDWVAAERAAVLTAQALASYGPHNGLNPGLAARCGTRLLAIYRAEITRRGGETTIQGRHGDTELVITDRDGGLAVLRAAGWRRYGQQGNRHVALAYLCGREDGQRWAVRVPGTVTTVAAALAWLTPAAARAARAAGRRVTRQGDVYAVETSSQYDGTGTLPDRHVWVPQARALTHPQHGVLHLPWPVRFVPQNAYRMGRSGSRGYGD